jgi:hypothetical protein
MRVCEYLGVPGTHASRRGDDWNHLGSAFTRFALKRGLVSVEERAVVPFFWSTDYDRGSGKHEDWRALGYALFYYFVPPLGVNRDRIPGNRTRIIAHSHAGQGALYAAAFGLKIECLVTVGTPVVKQMEEVAKAARPNIKRWLHLRSDSDFWQLAGAFFDRRLGFYRDMKLADRNEKMPKGHGDVLRDPELFKLWVDNGWFSYLKGESNDRAQGPRRPNDRAGAGRAEGNLHGGPEAERGAGPQDPRP